jgi:hypothetical protein
MAKLTMASPDLEKLVQEVAQEMGLTQMGVEFQALNAKKAKEIVKVSKANEVTEILSDKENLVVIIAYEEAFDRVDEKTRWMWIRMALDCVSYDPEKDKISLSTPTITVPLGFYQKYGNVAVQNAELALLTIQQIQDEERERKEAEKALKKARKKNK